MRARSSATKERILAAAAQLFAEQGYHGTGMGDLEQAVNLRRGALYYHIGSKENLLYDISISLVAEMQRLADAVDASENTADEKLRLLARGLMRMIGERQAEITVFYREWSWLTGERKEEVLAVRDRFENVWRKLLTDGVAEGTFVEKPPVLVKGILGVINYSYLWFSSAGPMTADAVADEFVDMILYGIAASAPNRNGRRPAPKPKKQASGPRP